MLPPAASAIFSMIGVDWAESPHQFSVMTSQWMGLLSWPRSCSAAGESETVFLIRCIRCQLMGTYLLLPSVGLLAASVSTLVVYCWKEMTWFQYFSYSAHLSVFIVQI